MRGVRTEISAVRTEMSARLETLQKMLWALITFVAVFVALHTPAMLNTFWRFVSKA